jgi:predicted esterase
LVAIDKTLFLETESETGETVGYGVPIAAYPSEAGKVIVNSPGSGELKDGREDRWRNLGLYLQKRGLASLVTFNAPRPDFQVQLEWEPYSYQGASWNKILIESLSHTIDWSLENAKELCGNASPDIYLTGFSSGGSSVGAVAHRYPSVKRILLLSTYDSVGDQFYEGVTAFTGDIYLVYGDQDPMAGYLARILRTGKFAAKSFLVREAPECGHRFDGEANTKLLTQAFHWAFEGDNSQPLNPGN